ncbi:cell division protein FtsK [Streptomyces netropsis]|uniref:S-DNA-T family DNA segregation ATPase FtsK/SpoIIIE n=1 Tax=Streptomyces netropsis TaxID=55404 RepID=A0A7W7LGZ7_STRNE|nr:cell division protein FtsK [Streptomyces netropsis]MBB4890093.1 S-DNA-T family DNA segregation ATPase FtsK/SpoIIIE [Streptomyces netropsis]GGR43246.1 cell division protein FtsK [Streptomyces netropsis]
MNHDDENELFARLEADMGAGPAVPGGEVVDLGKARAARTEAAEPGDAPTPVADSATDKAPTSTPGGPGGSDSDTRGVAKSELVDSSVPVESGPGLLDRIKGAKRLDVIPGWMRSWPEFRDAVTWLAGHAGHTAAFHAVRAPLYAGKLAVRTPRGVVNVLTGVGRWASDAEGEPLRQAEARRENSELYLKLARQRDRRVRLRTIVTASGTLLALGLALFLVFGASLLTQTIAAVLAMLVFGQIGAPADAPLSSRAVIKTEVQKLTSDMVVKAMASIGIGPISSAVAKGQEAITFVAPITREGPGWRADVDLPLGVTVADVVDRRSRLASGLRRPLGCVWPDGDPSEHEGRLILWVGDQDLSKTGKVKWQLAKASQHDIFNRNPFGIDPRGRAQSVPMIQHNVLIGSLPGQGKTSAVRVLACGAALDPSVELWIHENKGTGDLDAFAPISHRFVSGIDDEAIKYSADSLALLRKEVMRRAGALKKLPRDLCPDKRITRQIADKRSLKLWPLVAVFDECQNVFGHSEYGKQAGEDAEFIIKLGRALGVILILATQRPDKDSLPTGVSGNVSIRFCLHVAGQTENDMVLGTSSYKNGLRATIFRPEIDAGNGYLKGATPTPVVVRTAYLDGPATERIAQRARALRKAMGTLSGQAIGEEAEMASGPSYDLLADILAVVPESEERVWNERIAARLAEIRPDVYGGWQGENVTSALKPHGVTTRGVAGATDEGSRTTRRGIVREHVAKAMAERDGSTGAA